MGHEVARRTGRETKKEERGTAGERTLSRSVARFVHLKNLF